VTRAPVLLLVAILLAGCGGSTPRPAAAPKPPHIPRPLAHMWSAQATAVAQALAAGDGCGAQQRANQLRDEVVQAVNRRQVPARFQETLAAAVNDLPARITCNPAPPAPQPHPPHPDHGPGHGPGHGHGHGQGGDQ
jgi:hypothetical protein